jgi:hypothetical protein
MLPVRRDASPTDRRGQPRSDEAVCLRQVADPHLESGERRGGDTAAAFAGAAELASLSSATT